MEIGMLQAPTPGSAVRVGGRACGIRTNAPALNACSSARPLVTRLVACSSVERRFAELADLLAPGAPVAAGQTPLGRGLLIGDASSASRGDVLLSVGDQRAVGGCAAAAAAPPSVALPRRGSWLSRLAPPVRYSLIPLVFFRSTASTRSASPTSPAGQAPRWARRCACVCACVRACCRRLVAMNLLMHARRWFHVSLPTQTHSRTHAPSTTPRANAAQALEEWQMLHGPLPPRLSSYLLSGEWCVVVVVLSVCVVCVWAVHCTQCVRA
jgi:hypothetical protein